LSFDSAVKRVLLIGLALASMVQTPFASADVVKPALIEISAYKNGALNIEIRASIEALLTGINGQYKQTGDSPFAAAYDALRVLPPEELAKQFTLFESRFLNQIWLKVGSLKVALRFDAVDIPAAGYTKVPRISTINLTGLVSTKGPDLQWYYPARFGDSAVRVRQIDLRQQQWHWSQWQWIRIDTPSQRFSLTEVVAPQPLLKVIWSYIVIGFLHIVPKGLDHILFILGIFLLTTRARPLLWQITMFTFAHTLTLGLSTAGIIELPARLVEPLIALSIAYVGIENLFLVSLTSRRLILVFAFGLIHGLGFASVLKEFGMPADDFFTALISFNVGVELGQLAVVSAAFLLVGFWFAEKAWYRKVVIIPGSLVISATGVLWTLDRLAG
jgi:hydrogenase/urease accessory protein HupE